jgi:hypothetical protein
MRQGWRAPGVGVEVRAEVVRARHEDSPGGYLVEYQ